MSTDTVNKKPNFFNASSGIKNWIYTLDHKRIGVMYLVASTVALLAGGVFALWSDDPPDDHFMHSLEEVFVSCESHIVTFDNPIRGGESSSTVYVARRSPT